MFIHEHIHVYMIFYHFSANLGGRMKATRWPRGMNSNREPRCRLSKNHWRQVIKKQNPNSKCKANHRHQRSTKTGGLKPASQHHCNNQDAEHESRIQHYCSTKTQSSKPASYVKLDAEFEARVSQASPQWQSVRPKARVSVITALITGSITTHIMRELTPMMEYF